MKLLVSSAFAATFLLAGCADTGDYRSSVPSASKAAKEDYVTGSRIPRSESNENYQGSKTMTGKDYRDYKASQGLKSE